MKLYDLHDLVHVSWVRFRCSTYTDPAHHLITAAIGSMGSTADDLDRDSPICEIPGSTHQYDTHIIADACKYNCLVASVAVRTWCMCIFIGRGGNGCARAPVRSWHFLARYRSFSTYQTGSVFCGVSYFSSASFDTSDLIARCGSSRALLQTRAIISSEYSRLFIGRSVPQVGPHNALRC